MGIDGVNPLLCPFRLLEIFRKEYYAMKKIKYRSKLRLFLGRRMFILLMLLAQIVLLLTLILRGRQLQWLVPVLSALSIVTVLHLITRPDKYAFKILWTFLILLFPVFGGVMYWTFHFQTASTGFRKTLQKIEDEQHAEYRTLCVPEEPHLPNGQDQKLLSYLRNTAVLPAYKHTESHYLGDGKEMLASLLADMRSAERFIFIEYFIIEEGVMWNAILDVLRDRVAAGVDVRVIYDDLGCLLTLPVEYQKTLRSYGIQCEIFNRFHPLLTTLQNNRDHRKIAVIDGKIAYTGGINLADEYINEKIRFGHWRDSAVRMQGAAAESFTAMFLQTWHLLSREYEPLHNWIGKRDSATRSDGWVQPYADSPMSKIRVGERIYSHAISRSQKSLSITTPYLTVGEEMISALKWCAQSGVDVRIITPGMPDKKIVFFTTRSYYRELLGAGVKIFEYTPGFVHAKMIVSDDDFCMIGSTNMDFRSLYLNYECGACFYGTSMIADIKKDILEMQNDCREITLKDCKSNFLIRLLQDVCRMLSPIM